MTNRLFTDGIKDVIGNEPVLDQFDIAYDASFYGTMQDDYVTGTLLSANYSSDGSVKSFTQINKRGRVFSKLYASSQPTPDLSTAEVESNPYAAFREIPWYTKVGSALRLSQHIDSEERIYDTCLPSLVKSFAADNSEPWFVSDQTNSTTQNEKFYSSVSRLPTSNACFILFNEPKGEIIPESSRAVNNDWTWSYPYEEKYSPRERSLKLETQIRNIENVTLGVRYRPSLASTSRRFRAKTLQYLIPIFAGNYNLVSGTSVAAVAKEGRDSFRGTFSLPTGTLSDKKYDNLLGYSYTMPVDINYGTGPNYLTSSSVPSDTIKALYGFGDHNTVGYPVKKEVEASGTLTYTLGLGLLQDNLVASNDAALQSACNHIDSIQGGATYAKFPTYFFINWQATPRLKSTLSGDTSKYTGWGVIQSENKNLSAPVSTIKTKTYFYVSGSTPPTPLNGGEEITTGVAWPHRIITSYANTRHKSVYGVSPYSVGSKSNFNIFASNTSVANGGGQELGMSSIMSFDVTSSLAWRLSYDRVVASDSTNYFVSYISRRNTRALSADTNVGYDSFEEWIDFTNYVVSEGGSDSSLAHEVLETAYGEGSDPADLHVPTNFTSKILDPGEYRINFAYVKPINSTQSGIDRAFVTWLDIRLWDPENSNSYTTDTTKRVGWNHEPEYRRKFVDLPIESTVVDGYEVLQPQFYAGKAMGLAPVIRGWRHGLYNGLPSNTKAVFRRDRYGQLRDMLEQRVYTKIVKDPTSRITGGIAKLNQVNSTRTIDNGIMGSPVVVKFVKRRYSIGVDEYDKNVGKIYNEEVEASLTTSQNLSTESVSSMPYSDGLARMRTEEEYASALSSYTISAVSNNMGNISFT